MFEGLKFTIQFNDNATQRTRNRINERGPFFRLLSTSKTVYGFEGREAVLLRSLDERWLGWLPKDEIEITKAEG